MGIVLGFKKAVLAFSFHLSLFVRVPALIERINRENKPHN